MKYFRYSDQPFSSTAVGCRTDHLTSSASGYDNYITKSVELSKSSNTNQFTDTVSRKIKRHCTQRQVVDVTTGDDVQQ